MMGRPVLNVMMNLEVERGWSVVFMSVVIGG